MLFLMTELLPAKKKREENPVAVRACVSNSGPWAKFGPQCNYIWPARQRQMTTRAGSPAYMWLTLQIPECSADVFVHQLGQNP